MPTPSSATPLRLNWPLPWDDGSAFGRSAEIAPDGTVYVARTRVTGTERVVRGEGVQDTLVTAFDTSAAIRFRVPAVAGVTMMPHGLSADERGVYLFVRVDRPFELQGVRVSPPTTPSGALIALDPRGGLRWVRTLGPAAWQAGSFLSGRRPDRVVVVGAATGSPGVGNLRAPRSGARVVSIELSRDGDALAVRDLGEAGSGFNGDMNATGDILTSVADDPPAWLSVSRQLTRWTVDGRRVWQRWVADGVVALDDDGNAYLALSNHHDLPPPGSATFRVVSVDPAGQLRWDAALSPHGGGGYSAKALTWRDGKLHAALSAEGCESPLGPCNGFRYYATMSLDAEGRGTFTRAASLVGVVVYTFAGGGRRCEVLADEGWGPGREPPPWGALRCEGDQGGCRGTEVRCAGVCADLRSDPEHCGACGRSCARAFPGATGVCSLGACHYGVCEQGRASCDGEPRNGCEVDVSTDAAHCGACDLRCGVGERCVGGRCCAGDRCAASPYASDGSAGAFAPRGDVTLDGAVRQVTTAVIPEGVTVRSADGVLRLYARGDVRIDGIIDLTGRPGVTCPLASLDPTCADASPGAAPGRGGYFSDRGSCGRCISPSPRVHPVHSAYGPMLVSTHCGPWCGNEGAGRGTIWYGNDAESGAIGDAAVEDLAVYTVFEPGSRGGQFQRESEQPQGVTVHYGGGGGGAVRIVSSTRIVLGPHARVLADGGNPRGSGGVVVLHAPEVRVAAGAVVSAVGVVLEGMLPGTSLGRVRVSVDAARCSLDGTFRPPLVAGCLPTPPVRGPAHTYVTAWPL